MSNSIDTTLRSQLESSKYTQKIQSLEEIVLNISDNNIMESVDATMNFINVLDNPNLFLSQLIYSAFIARMKDFNIYLNYMKEIGNKEGKNEIIDTFSHFILEMSTQESYYILHEMIDLNLISSDLVKDKKTFYFAHYMSEDMLNNLKNPFLVNMYPFWRYFILNYLELSKNDWELHKQLIKEGHNPNEIAKIIRNDEIEKLQEISSQTNFDFNQIIKPSLYERCSFINQENVTLIDYAAFFSAVKCFKFLMLNNAKLDNTGKYAIAGGNLEIIHLCEQNHSIFKDAYETAIEYHKNEIFKYIYENKGKEYSILKPNELLILSIKSLNIKLFYFLIKQEGIDVNAKDI